LILTAELPCDSSPKDKSIIWLVTQIVFNISNSYNIFVVAVYRPKDLGRDYKKVIDNAIRDLSPDTKENVINIFSSWEGTSSIDRLSKLVGPDKAKDLMKKIKGSADAALTQEEQNALKDIFKDSLTFD
jgi:hypothetical protein